MSDVETVRVYLGPRSPRMEPGFAALDRIEAEIRRLTRWTDVLAATVDLRNQEVELLLAALTQIAEPRSDTTAEEYRASDRRIAREALDKSQEVSR